MMTAIVVIEICEMFKIDFQEEMVEICKLDVDIRGTSAKLRDTDLLSVEQLLYGMMLPSGNDAAFALARHFGSFIFESRDYGLKEKTSIQSFQFNQHCFYVKYFLKEMNDKAQALKMNLTKFDSPHGLQNIYNLSCAFDLALLAHHCMQNITFQTIVGTQHFEC
jgi:D-alanyl-D-alanine carboxypeptidase